MKKAKYARTTDIEGLANAQRNVVYFLDSARIILTVRKNGNSFLQPKGEMIDFVGRLSESPPSKKDAGVEWADERESRTARLAWGESDRRNGTAVIVLGADL